MCRARPVSSQISLAVLYFHFKPDKFRYGWYRRKVLERRRLSLKYEIFISPMRFRFAAISMMGRLREKGSYIKAGKPMRDWHIISA